MDGLIAAVGEERFRDAQEWAWATAAGTGRSLRSSGDDEWPAGIVDVPHDLSDLIWDKSEEPWLARLELAFELYRQMPCYATLMYMPHKEWDDEAKGRFWDEYRSLLSDDDDRLADPVAYSLWCDYFEDPDTVEEAWLALASPGSVSDRGLERMLEVWVQFRMRSRFRSTSVSSRARAGTRSSSAACFSARSTCTDESTPRPRRSSLRGSRCRR